MLSGFLGFLGVFAGDLLESSGNSPFRALSARSDASSISTEKLNLFGPTEGGERLLDQRSSQNGFPLFLYCVLGSLALVFWVIFR